MSTRRDRHDSRPRRDIPRPGLRLLPTLRAVSLAVLAVALWILGDVTALAAPRALAAGLLIALLLGFALILPAAIRLRPKRQVRDSDVPVGGVLSVQLELPAGAPAGLLPLGRGAVRAHLPEALGGTGDLSLTRRMPHRLPVRRRGVHALGPLTVAIRDPLGLFHLRRTLHDDAQVTALPAVEEVSAPAARAAGIAMEGSHSAPPSPGAGEMGPIPRPYAPGDDIRRIHWKASARTGRLMTREEEPQAPRVAVILLDTRPVGPGSEPQGTGSARRAPGEGQRALDDQLALEDRLVEITASLLLALSAHGWQVRVLDASGDEITRCDRTRSGGVIGGAGHDGVIGREADALGRRSALHGLAAVGFEDTEPLQGGEAGAGSTALLIAVGPAPLPGPDGAAREPLEGLDVDRCAGRAARRIAIAVRCDPDGESAGRNRADGDAAVEPQPGESPAPEASRRGPWILVRARTAHPLSDILQAIGEVR